MEVKEIHSFKDRLNFVWDLCLLFTPIFIGICIEFFIYKQQKEKIEVNL